MTSNYAYENYNAFRLQQDELMNQAWFLACEAEGYPDGEVPEWAIQMVSDTQLEIYNRLSQIKD
jgi:hypothetical protein